MLGMFNLLLFLKGWQYKEHTMNRTLTPGTQSDPLRFLETGWLLSIGASANDAYAGVSLEYQDAELQSHTFESSPTSNLILCSFQQDPAGSVRRYTRPNPYSTGGLYLWVVHSGGFQGSAWPIVPTTTVRLSLGAESNQASANVFAIAYVLAVTDKNLFIQSLRQVMDSQADIQVPKEILSLGPTSLIQQPNKTDTLLESILAELKLRK